MAEVITENGDREEGDMMKEDDNGQAIRWDLQLVIQYYIIFIEYQEQNLILLCRLTQGPPLNSAAPVFVPRDGGPPREQHAAQQRRDGHDHSRGDRRDGLWERDRAGAQSSRHNDRGHARPSSSHGGPDGHDRRYGDDAGRRKRSRSPEPGEDTERDISKRFKPAPRTSSSPPRGSNSRSGDRDRSDRRSDRKIRSSRH
jgi:hypothetical protein